MLDGGFNILIKDSFIEKEFFDKIKNLIPTLHFGNNHYLRDGPSGHVWFSADTEKDVENYIKEKCEKILNKKLKVILCSYTMVATVEPLVHQDAEFCDYQALIYIKGNENIHKGTGFYVLNKDKNTFELNTHVGFKENRGVIWESGAWHSPMNWLAEDKSKRYAVIIQFKELR